MVKRFDLFPTNMLIEQYRTVFSSRSGLNVLAHMLYDLGVFQSNDGSPEDVALNNYGKRLLTILGAGQPDEKTLQFFIKRLMKQSLPKEN